ncbi:MAG: DUF3313 domain-containing protein, partial [Candidatus Omnitrophica bacterium]|nr:DUF3313 domain-containing protein [Candidatus Omnitrophota bacterium]
MKRGLIFIFVAGLIFTAGCATVKNTRPGFLKDYNVFTESQGYSGMFVDNRNLAKINDYNKYLIDPVVTDFVNKNGRDQVPQDFIQDIANYFHVQVVKGLQDKYQIVDAPGAGVLRIRLAITDIDSSKPYFNSDFATKLTEAGAGGASMEAELVDSVTVERIAAVIDCRKASEWVSSLLTHTRVDSPTGGRAAKQCRQDDDSGETCRQGGGA